VGNDHLETDPGSGNDRIVQDGGPGDDTIKGYGGDGDDDCRINGGEGRDAIVYVVSAGDDSARIDGGKGRDTLEIKSNNQNFTVRDAKGKVLHKSGEGGSTIRVKNVESITIDGAPLTKAAVARRRTVPAVLAMPATEPVPCSGPRVCRVSILPTIDGLP
jgi:Ca2+-binding RTX toxin-like protein